MTPLDYQDPTFQAIIRKELNLDAGAVFQSCDLVAGTEISRHCIGSVMDRDITYLLLRCTFRYSGDTIILNLDVPGAPVPRAMEKEIIGKGLDPKKVRAVGVCANTAPSKKQKPDEPEIQVVMIPY